MTCAACQSRVQRTLAAQPGVLDASVNLVTKSAAVRYDPAATDPERLIAAVRATGYDAELPAANEDVFTQSARADGENREFRVLIVRATVSAVAGNVAGGRPMGGGGGTGGDYFVLGPPAGGIAWAARGGFCRAAGDGGGRGVVM